MGPRNPESEKEFLNFLEGRDYKADEVTQWDIAFPKIAEKWYHYALIFFEYHLDFSFFPNLFYTVDIKAFYSIQVFFSTKWKIFIHFFSKWLDWAYVLLVNINSTSLYRLRILFLYGLRKTRINQFRLGERRSLIALKTLMIATIFL